MTIPPPNPPRGYITFEDFAKLLPVNQKTISKYINASPTDKYMGKYKIFLDANTESIMSGSYRYFKKPTATQLKKIKDFFGRTTISQDLINDIKALHNSKVVQSSLKNLLNFLKVPTSLPIDLSTSSTAILYQALFKGLVIDLPLFILSKINFPFFAFLGNSKPL